MINLVVSQVSRTEWIVSIDSGRDDQKTMRHFTGPITANLYAVEMFNILCNEFGYSKLNIETFRF